jgi:ApaG protein
MSSIDQSTATHFRFTIRVEPRFIPEESDVLLPCYMFNYRVRIENTGEVPARVLGRHWVITDAADRVEEVQGEGVVGERPYLRPGDVFEYTSGCPLPTKVGTMRGSFKCRLDNGSFIDVQIPEFVLAAPNALH